jgi:DNA-binding GntR family transcriptional regulator
MSVISTIEKPQNLTEQAVSALRREIVACRLAPGDTVSEALMSERFSFGRAAIRAALARLGEEGLVQSVARRGWVVSLVTIRDIHEVFDLRLLLEPEAARRAAGHANLDRLRRLDDVCAQGYNPADSNSALDFLAVNHEFHVAVGELAGNLRLARQIGRLLDESTRMLVLGLSTRDRSGEMAHEHRALVQAMADQQPSEAARIMHEQVTASRDMVLTALTSPFSKLVVSEFT